jgi:hypothetical protein
MSCSIAAAAEAFDAALANRKAFPQPLLTAGGPGSLPFSLAMLSSMAVAAAALEHALAFKKSAPHPLAAGWGGEAAAGFAVSVGAVIGFKFAVDEKIPNLAVGPDEPPFCFAMSSWTAAVAAALDLALACRNALPQPFDSAGAAAEPPFVFLMSLSIAAVAEDITDALACMKSVPHPLALAGCFLAGAAALGEKSLTPKPADLTEGDGVAAVCLLGVFLSSVSSSSSSSLSPGGNGTAAASATVRVATSYSRGQDHN